MLTIRVAGVARPVSAVTVWVNGAARPVKLIRVFDDGVLRTVFPPASAFSAAIQPDYAYAAQTSRGYRRITSNDVTATPSGGRGPYSYAWSVGDASVSIGSPGMATTSFYANLYDDTIYTTATCQVTDANGATAGASVEVTLSHTATEDFR